MTEGIEQRSDAWFAARCGSLGASQIADAVAVLKDGKTPAATSANLAAKLVIERLTGVQEDGFKSAAMQWGIDQEENAKRAYEALTGEFASDVGLYTHPTIKGTHASPDGLVGVDGLVEIKCPNSATHIETLLSKKPANKYVTQMQWEMACTGRKWTDFVSFDPRLPERLRFFQQRVHRDDTVIAQLEKDVELFLSEIEDTLKRLEHGD